MDKATRIRWAVLLSAFAGTAVASFYPVEQAGQPVTVRATATARPPKGQLTTISLPVTIGPTATLTPEVPALLEAQSAADPFEPRGWQQPAPPPPPAPVMPVVAAPVEPVGPPPLPFSFVGRMAGEGQNVVYLRHGEQMLIAREGETLEDAYKIVSLNTQRVEFEHLPTGEKQVLDLPLAEQ